MKKLILILALTIICFRSTAQTWDWAKPEPNGIGSDPYGTYGSNSEDDNAHDVATDSEGHIYVLGDFADSLYLNNIFRERGSGSYLAKYDSTGNLLWYETIVPIEAPSEYNQYSINSIQATNMTVNAQGIFLTGKYNPSTVSGINCSTGEVFGENYHSYKIGSFTFTSSYEDYGFFITKLNSSGSVVWNKTGSAPLCINNGIYSEAPVTYNPVITSDNNDNIITSFVYSTTRSFISIGSDAIFLSGSNSINPYHLVVAKFSQNGILQWANYAGGGYNNINNCGGGYGYIEDCNSMMSDGNGNIFFYGTAMDSTFFGSQLFETKSNYLGECGRGNATFIAKISSIGTWQFVKELCAISQNYLELGVANPSLLTVDKANNLYALVNSPSQDSIYMGGIKIAGGIGIPNTHVVKFDNNGNTKWVKDFGQGVNVNGYANDYANGISYNGNDFYITGGLRNVHLADFKFSKLTVPPSCDNGTLAYYVAKADTSANFLWANTFCAESNTTGFDICTYGNNVYTVGYYRVSINSLGAFNVGFTNSDPYTHQIFFGKLKDEYIHIDEVTPTTLCTGNSVTIPFTSFGLAFSNANTFTAQLSDSTGNFDHVTDIGVTTSTGTGTITATLPELPSGSSGYRVRIVSSELLKTGFPYYAYADTNYAITIGGQTFYQDIDADGYGNTSATSLSCSQPSGYVSVDGDCNDFNAAIHPGAAETCNGIDDNCDGEIDEGVVLATYYQDNDGDGYGNSAVSIQSCTQPAGYVAAGGDCSDNNAALSPGVAETCNGIDDNCDGQIDEGVVLATYYQDNDGDGYGNSAVFIQSCTQPAGYVAAGGDCSDINAAQNPGATETCNGIDDNCDGQIDEGVILATYYQDNDGDGYGNSAVSTQSCTQPAGYVAAGGDCSDNNAAIKPGAVEICGNGIDDNCNGQIDESCTTTTPPLISINDVTVYESQGTATLTVSLSKTSTQTIKINYSTVDGTAVSKGKGKNPVIDYTALKGTVTIPAGSTTGTIAISIINNLPTEPTEFFDVQLSLPKNINATISDGSGRVTILDGAATLATIQSVTEIGSEAFTAKIYPNPGAEQFQLQVYTESKEEITVRIVDMLGRQMKIWKAQPDQISQFGMELTQGVYVAEIRQGLNLRTITFIKQ